MDSNHLRTDSFLKRADTLTTSSNPQMLSISIEFIHATPRIAQEDIKKAPLTSQELLFLGAKNNNKELIRKALKHNQDEVNSTDDQKKTPLDYALAYGNFNAVRYLLARIQRIEQEQEKAQTAQAARERAVSLPTDIVRTALINQLSIYEIQGFNTQQKQLKVFNLLLDAVRQNSRIDEPDQLLQTPLHVAVSHDTLEHAEALLAHKANPNAQDAKGDTPLHKVVATGNTQMLTLLVLYGAQLNITNKKGETPFQSALISYFTSSNSQQKRNAYNFLRILLKANDTARELFRESALDYASVDDVEHILKQNGSFIDTGYGHIHRVLNLLIALKERVDQISKCLKEVNHLFDTYDHIFANFGYDYGMPDKITTSSHTKVHGIDIETELQKKREEQQVCIDKIARFTKIIALLIRYEALTDKVDQNGNIPLKRAQKHKFQEIINLLQQN